MALVEGDGRPDGITQLREAGQSVWLDDLGRHLLDDGSLQSFIDEGVSGVTSNPTIFAASFGSAAYDGTIRELAARGLSPAAITEALVLEDVGRAADLLLPVHEATAGADGFVSIEVAPRLAHDVEGTVAEAKRLRDALARPNVMVKVPGTEAGVEAVRRLVADGVDVNVTLLFSIRRYAAVLEAFVEGLEERVAAGEPRLPQGVASFFLSRIDAAIDPLLDASGGPWTRRIRGLAAVASARMAYQIQADVQSDVRWLALAHAGARPQRLLWASTGVKDPQYAPTKYVEALALDGTVTTLNRQTLAATLAMSAPEAPDVFATIEAVSGKLSELGIDLAATTRDLEVDGLTKFQAAQDAMEAAITGRLAPGGG